MKYNKISTWFLAISIFMFGVLKLINPFKSWYRVQITNADLGQLSYVTGITGEITVGTTLLLCLLYKQKISAKAFELLTTISYSVIVIMMLIAVYVHLHPDVPAEVLPLKIKAPYIPLTFLTLALSNIVLTIYPLFRANKI